MSEERERTIDWSSAQVHRGALAVQLTGKFSKAWHDRFAAVQRMLAQGGQEWGGVSLEKKAIEVTAVQPGAEENLHHFLESVVVQVNSELCDKQERSGEIVDPETVVDQEMAESFRAFADRRG